LKNNLQSFKDVCAELENKVLKTKDTELSLKIAKLKSFRIKVLKYQERGKNQ
jgi:hypothetical protein